MPDIHNNQFQTDIEAIYATNKAIFASQNVDMAAVLPLILKIFPNSQGYIWELIQNALDAHASVIYINTNTDTLEFSHNGSTFSTKDLQSLSKIGLSTKGLHSIGCMGIGFKSVFKRFQIVQIRDIHYQFAYDVTCGKHIGMVLPQWDDTVPTSTCVFNPTVSFFLSHRQNLTHHRPVDSDLLQISENIDTIAILAIKGLRKLILNNIEYTLSLSDKFIYLSIFGDSSATQTLKWFYTKSSYTPSTEAMAEFYRNRHHQHPQILKDSNPLPQETHKREVIAFLPVNEQDLPLPPKKPTIFASLPTGLELDLGFHIHADWLINADRQDLINVEESQWQREIIHEIPQLIFNYLSAMSEIMDEPPFNEHQQKHIRSILSIFRPLTSRNHLCSFMNTADFRNKIKHEVLNQHSIIPALDNNTLVLSNAEVYWLPEPLSKHMTLDDHAHIDTLFNRKIGYDVCIESDTRDFLIDLYGLEITPDTMPDDWVNRLTLWKQRVAEKHFNTLFIGLLAGLLEWNHGQPYLYGITCTGKWMHLDRLHIPPREDNGLLPHCVEQILHLQGFHHLSPALTEHIYTINSPASYSVRCALLSYTLANRIEYIILNHIRDCDIDWTNRQDVLNHIVAPTLWLTTTTCKLTHVVIDHEDQWKLAPIETVVWFEASTTNTDMNEYFPDAPTLSPLYFDEAEQNPICNPIQLMEYFNKQGFLNYTLLTETVELFNTADDIPSQYQKVKAAHGDLDLRTLRKVQHVKIITRNLHYQFHSNASLLHKLLEENINALYQPKIQVQYFKYSRYVNCTSNEHQPWVTELQTIQWVPDKNGCCFYRPEAIFPPSTNSLNLPVADISPGLFQRLQSIGIEFGTNIDTLSNSVQNEIFLSIDSVETIYIDVHDPERDTNVGKQGELQALQYEHDRGRSAKQMPPNHPGYDIETIVDGATHYIEVKSFQDGWTGRKLSITRTQLKSALEHREYWWLYVIEHVGNPNKEKLYRIPNPFIRIQKFELPVKLKNLHLDG